MAPSTTHPSSTELVAQANIPIAGSHLDDLLLENGDENNEQNDQDAETNTKPWDSTSIRDMKEVKSNAEGVDLKSVNDSAKHILGMSISEICKDVHHPDYDRLLHVEPVFRADLVAKFLQRSKTMKQGLMRLSKEQLKECISDEEQTKHGLHSIEAMADYLTKPHVTFHGAPRATIPAIVRHGFLKPGDRIGESGKQVSLERGHYYGLGVYSSWDFNESTLYADAGLAYHTPRRSGPCSPAELFSSRVIVCATLMGLSLEVKKEEVEGTKSVAHPLANSHVSQDGYEYCVFDTEQIIPCYVIHIDSGPRLIRQWTDYAEQQTANRIQKPKPRVENWSSLDHRARKQALKALAMKYLPFGFGTAKGTSFVVEDVADTLDDDEDDGDSLAAAATGVDESFNRPADENASWFDEYQAARFADGIVLPDNDNYIERVLHDGWYLNGVRL